MTRYMGMSPRNLKSHAPEDPDFQAIEAGFGMLIEAGRSVLLVIDVQERLLPAMVEHCVLLAKAASRLEIPTLLSEQYPKGLGPTVPDLAALVPAASIHAKLHFSCAADPGLSHRLSEIGRPQIVIAGIETHVCVLQTALGFRAGGFAASSWRTRPPRGRRPTSRQGSRGCAQTGSRS
jgi:isochorismate hydrolase